MTRTSGSRASSEVGTIQATTVIAQTIYFTIDNFFRLGMKIGQDVMIVVW
ncbi:MAG: hypothetical protein AAF902_17935 [Chloroflexota bacterium]